MSLNKLIRPKDVTTETPIDVIYRAWLAHTTHLLPQDKQDMLARWVMVDKLIREGTIVEKKKTLPKKTGKKSIGFSWDDEMPPEEAPEEPKLKEVKHLRYHELVEWLVQYYGVSTRTAYDDIANAKRFFLSTWTRGDVEYARGVSIEHGEKMMWQAYDAGKYEAAAMLYKELNKIKGLHAITEDVPDYADFQPPALILTDDPTDLGFEKVENHEEVIKRILGERRKEFLESEAQDVEAEDDTQ